MSATMAQECHISQHLLASLVFAPTPNAGPRKPDKLPNESHSELPRLPQANGLHQAHLTSPLFYCKPFPPLCLSLSVCQTQVRVAEPLVRAARSKQSHWNSLFSFG